VVLYEEAITLRIQSFDHENMKVIKLILGNVEYFELKIL